jgi:hypothetical protein
MNVHTAANAVPPVDGTELGDLLEDLDGIHEGIEWIRNGIRLLALCRLTPEQTQTAIVTLAGGTDGTDVLTAIGLLVARLTNPDSNPALRTLDLNAQKDCQLHGELLVHDLADDDLHQHASDASAAIHTD